MHRAKQLYGHSHHWLWNKDKTSEPRLLTLLRHFLQIVSALIADLREGQLSLRAMSLVYTTVISLVPLFAISFSVLKGLGAHNQIKPFLLSTLEPLGEKRFEITEKIIGFVDNIQVGVLGALGIIILVYTVIGMMQKIEHAFNYVWHVSKSRTLGQRFSDYLSVLLVGPLLIFLSAGMTTSARSHAVVERLSGFPFIDELLTLVGIVIPYLILAGAFTFLYSFVPNTRVRLGAAFIGGLMTAFIWKMMGWGFATFVANSANQTAIYSAFATIIVFMVWIYLVWLVLLIGSSIGFYWQFPEYRRIRHSHVNIGPAMKEAIAIQIMQETAKRFAAHEKPPTTGHLAELCHQPQQAIEEMVGYLKSGGLLTLEEQTHGFLPARPLAHISLYDIIRTTRSHGGQALDLPESMKKNPLTTQMDEALKAALATQSLESHVAGTKKKAASKKSI